MDRLGSQQVSGLCPPLALISAMDNGSDAVEIRQATRAAFSGFDIFLP